jgi:hypothetical protein
VLGDTVGSGHASNVQVELEVAMSLLTETSFPFAAVRKRRSKTTTGREADWEYLVGSAPARFNPEQGLLVESSQNVSDAQVAQSLLAA